MQVKPPCLIGLCMDKKATATDFFAHECQAQNDISQQTGTQSISFVAFVDPEASEKRHRLRVTGSALC
jgi:hypothetical protein